MNFPVALGWGLGFAGREMAGSQVFAADQTVSPAGSSPAASIWAIPKQLGSWKTRLLDRYSQIQLGLAAISGSN